MVAALDSARFAGALGRDLRVEGFRPRKESTVPYRRAGRVALLAFGVLVVPTLCPGQADPGAGQPAVELPAPVGFGLTLYNQTQDMHITSLDVQLPGLDPQTLSNLPVDNNTTTFHFKLDYWVLPFLNVYAIFGTLEGSTSVKLSNVDLGLPITLNNLVVDYDGLVYGGGATLAGGWDRYFATLTFDYNETDLDVSTSSVTSWVVTPRFGFHDGPAAVYVGGMYQQAEERHEGIFNMPYLGAIPFEVELEQTEAWNYLVGLNAGVGPHWQLTVEGFFGDRFAVLAAVDYRWGRR